VQFIPSLEPPQSIAEEFGLWNVEQDGVAAMHDTESEAGDERGLADEFDLDRLEALELGVALDYSDDEPLLD
jgi:hypothetical protein